MSRKAWFMLPAAGLLAGVGALMACGSESSAASTLEQANARFSWDLYSRIAAGEGNIFFSPYSVSSALGMTLLGADGTTQEQMRRVIFGGADHHVDLGDLTKRLVGESGAEDGGQSGPADAGPAGLKPGGGPGQTGARPGMSPDQPARQDGGGRPFELTVANALWLQEGYALRERFMNASQRHYRARPMEVDYRADPESARGRINEWVADRTRQRIRDILAPGSVTPTTRLVLTNAIYFKSAWQKPFQKPATQPEPFHRPDGSTVEAPMMRQTDRFAYREIDGAQVLRLPYVGNELAMIVVLPEAVDGLAALEGTLTGDALLELANGEKDTVQRVAVMLPRFRIELAYDLIPPLKALGMPAAFDPAAADFSGMTGNRDLFIGTVAHKAFVEVDEQGTEAAAATAVGMALTSMPGPQDEPIIFKADRPFMFGIVHQPSNTILFLGRLADPTDQ